MEAMHSQAGAAPSALTPPSAPASSRDGPSLTLGKQPGTVQCDANVGLLIGAGTPKPGQGRFVNWEYTLDGGKKDGRVCGPAARDLAGRGVAFPPPAFAAASSRGAGGEGAASGAVGITDPGSPPLAMFAFWRSREGNNIVFRGIWPIVTSTQFSNARPIVRFCVTMICPVPII